MEVKDTYLIDAASDFASETERLEFLNPQKTALEGKAQNAEQMSIEAANIRKNTFEKAKAEAEAEAKAIIQKSKDEANQFRTQAGEDAKIEMENARQSGYAEGKQQAIDEVNAQFDFEIGQVKNLVNEIEVYKSDFIKKHDEVMKKTIIQIVEKIVNEKVEQDDKIFLSIYKKAVEDLSRQDWIKVSVAKKDFELATSSKDEMLSMLKGSPAFTVEVLRDAAEGTCVIETNTGVADASVDTQLERVKETILQADLT